MSQRPSEFARPGVREQSMLLREILECSGAFEKHLAQQLQVNATDLEAMEHLIQSGPLNPTEIARRLDLTTAAVTSSVDRLEALGHVERMPNPRDRRGVLVSATPTSLQRAMSILLPMIREVDHVLDGFDDQESAVITRYLEGVLGAYLRHTGEPAG